jgi:hypothetical protein
LSSAWWLWLLCLALSLERGQRTDLHNVCIHWHCFVCFCSFSSRSLYLFFAQFISVFMHLIDHSTILLDTVLLICVALTLSLTEPITGSRQALGCEGDSLGSSAVASCTFWIRNKLGSESKFVIAFRCLPFLCPSLLFCPLATPCPSRHPEVVEGESPSR